MNFLRLTRSRKQDSGSLHPPLPPPPSTGFDDLPRDVVFYLCHFLDAKSLLKLGQSSKSTYILLANEDFWKKIFIQNYGSMIESYEDEFEKRTPPKRKISYCFWREKYCLFLKTVNGTSWKPTNREIPPKTFIAKYGWDRGKANSQPPLLKIAIVGDCGIGKSATTIQFVQNQWFSEYDPTIECSYRKQILIEENPAVLDILDTADCDEFSY